MTEILCKWLNNDVKLSKQIEPSTFAQDFSNGYYFGEILNKHGLQDDFGQFSQSKVSNAKLNNFMRLEPTINLLDISFNTNFARDIIQEKPGSAVQLLYQMYIALTNKQKRQLTGAAMETMRPAAAVKLELFESQIYKNQLKAKTPRQTDIDLTQLKVKYEKFKIEQAEIAFEQKYREEERQREELQNKRKHLLEKSKKFRLQQAELAARINAAEVQIPKTPPKFKKEAMLERRKLFEKNEGEQALREISVFEKKFKGSNRENAENEFNIVDIEAVRSYDDENEAQTRLDPVDFLKPKTNDDYIGKIRNRLQEDAHARKEREKRRRKVLVDQLKGNEQLEEAKREEMLVSHMLRQSQFERRIAVELLHARHEKDVIRENVIQREREIELRREKEFYEALEKEKELARLAKLEYEDQVAKDKELYELIAADRAAQRYKKHYDICRGIINQIVDLSCKTAEYLTLNDNLIPPKIWRDWIKLYEAGLPLYEEDLAQTIQEEETDKDKTIVDEETQKLLDEGDFIEYKDLIGEWEISTDLNTRQMAPEDNKIVGFIINRLHNQCYPIQPGAPAPLFPKFPLKALVLGKPFAGKTSSLKILAKETGLKIVDPEKLINAAIEAYKRNPDLTIEYVEPKPESPSQAKLTAELAERSTSMEKKDSSKKKKKDKDQEQLNLQHEKSQLELMSESEVQFKEETHMIRQLGEKALQSLEAGEPIKDEIVVHIIIEKIRTLPEDKGWIIDGYPLTYNQAKLLEKAFTGYDADKPLPIRPKKEPILATNPKPDPPPPKHVSAIDVVIHLEVTNETIIKRSAGRHIAKLSQTQYHQEFKLPPEGSFTGLNNVETIQPVKDIANDMEQLQHRITAYEDNWGKVYKFYENYSKVTHIIADNIDEQTLAIEIHRALDDFIDERERKKREEEEKQIAEEAFKKQLEEQKEQEKLRRKQEEAEAELTRQREDEKAAAEREAAAAQTPSKSGKGKKDSKKDSKGTKSPKAQSPAKSKSSRKSASPKPKGKKESTPAPEVEAVQTPKPDEPQPPEPGSEDWQYVSEKLLDNVAKILCDQWDIVEDSYVEGSKYVFRKIRGDREKIIRYFFSIKQDFKEYLRRPDTKQEFIDTFIKMYNSISDDIRDDEEVKAELHQRAEDLKEDLWSICDRKKEESENELDTIKKDGWLADKIGILSNHYITLMQVELDRFFETGRMLKDYYKCQQGPIPDELPREYPRLPLIELRDPDDAESDNVENLPSERQKQTDAQPTDKPKSPKSPRKGSAKSPKPSSAKKTDAKASLKKGATKSSNDFEDGVKKRRIPLIPRRPTSADTKDKKKDKAKKSDDSSPPPPEDPDEKLIFDSFKSAISYVHEFMTQELAQYEDEDKGEIQVDDKSKPAKQSKSKGVILSKSRSPSAKGGKGAKGGKAGKQEEVVTQPASNLTEEEKAKKALRDRIKQEHVAALQKEEQAFKTRLEVIKLVATKLIQNLNQIADNCYKDMNDWLGSKWMKEMDSIKNLIEIIKNMIENKEKIKEQLILKQDEFFIDSDIVVLRSPTPPRRPDPVEQMTPELFSIEALSLMYEQFKLVAPEGLVAIKTFVDIYTDLATLNYGTEVMPENWSNLSQTQVEALAKMLSNGSEFVDWRHWLLYASVPWPYPTQHDLLETLKYYRNISKTSDYINEDEFMRSHLWFNMDTPTTPTDITQPKSFDRYSALLSFWFKLFSIDGLLDYKNMLLYMSACSDPYEGFLNALSVSQNLPMPRLDTKVQMRVSSYQPHPDYENISRHSQTCPNDQLVSIEAIHRVFHHGERLKGDTHRFASSEDPEDFMSMERIINIYNELSEDDKQFSLPYSKLIAHPVLCEMISNCTKFRAPDFRLIFNMQSSQDDNNDLAQDRRTPND